VWIHLSLDVNLEAEGMAVKARAFVAFGNMWKAVSSLESEIADQSLSHKP
jgi:hypothetical protein